MKSIIRRGNVHDIFAQRKQVLLNQFGQFSDVILPGMSSDDDPNVTTVYTPAVDISIMVEF
jgi:hypothetical protein